MRRTVIVFGICLFLFCLVCFLVFPRVLTRKAEVSETGGKNVTESGNVEINRNGSAPMASELVGLMTYNDSIEGNLTNDINVNDTKAVASNIDVAKKSLVIEINLKKSTADDVNTIKKTINMRELKKEIKLAEEDLALKTKRLEEIKRRANSTRALSEKAQDHLNALIFALNSLQSSLIHSTKAAFETDWQLQLQTAMYNEAKRKHARLSRELEMTIADYEKTKVAAGNAMAAAKVAQKNVGSDMSSSIEGGRYGDVFLGDFATKHIA